MDKKDKIFISCFNDPLFEIAAKAMNPNSIMSLEDFLSHVRVDNTRKFPLITFNERCVRRMSCDYIINRLFDMDSYLLAQIVEGWGSLSVNWFYFYASRFWQKASACYPWAPRGLSRVHLPLPTQWHLVSKSSLQIKVPRYTYGPESRQNRISELLNPIQKSIWSYPAWQNGDPPDDSINERDKLYVESPKGERVVGWRIGKNVLVQPTFFGEPRNTEKIKSFIWEISNIFDCELCEIIFFYEKESVQFQSCCPRMLNIGESQIAQDCVAKYLVS